MKAPSTSTLGMIILGFFFPPLWFMAGGKAISDAHTKERKEAAKQRRHRNRPHRKGVAAAKRHEKNIGAIWRERYQNERNKHKSTKNQLWQEKKINKAQKPMGDSPVNTGTYNLYRSGFKRISAITMIRQRLSTYTMPQIRAVCDEMLGHSKPTEFKGYGKRGKGG